MEFTNAFIEKMVNQTFPGLTLYYRDADLEQPVAGMYQPGQILRNGFFLDVTNMGGGIGQNTRFLVASTKAIPLSTINPEVKKWGLHVINVNAFFKVLDVIREGGKMQVLLLQIPEEGVELFRSAQINLEQQVITKGRERFYTCWDEPPLAELQTPEWLDRTRYPVGINARGEFFGLVFDPSLSSHPMAKMLAGGLEKLVTLKENQASPAGETPEQGQENEVRPPEDKKPGFWKRLFGDRW